MGQNRQTNKRGGEQQETFWETGNGVRHRSTWKTPRKKCSKLFNKTFYDGGRVGLILGSLLLKSGQIAITFNFRVFKTSRNGPHRCTRPKAA